MVTQMDEDSQRREQLNGLLRTCRARTPRPGGQDWHRGMRQEDVAARARIGVRRYAAFERGEFVPDTQLLEYVTVALHMTPAERTALYLLATGHDPSNQVHGHGRIPVIHSDTALRQIVSQLHPYPAAVLDETWTARFWNEAMDEWSGGWFSAQPDRHLVCYLFSAQVLTA
jgi:transcriptional regulator with XRE-family HTH domain